jgi:hypothetical protein
MENCTQRRYEGIEKALEGVDLKVEEIVKQGNKTVITALHKEANETAMIFDSQNNNK